MRKRKHLERLEYYEYAVWVGYVVDGKTIRPMPTSWEAWKNLMLEDLKG